MKPRPYQARAIKAVIEKLREYGSCLVVMPTGTGKTVVFSILLDMMKKGRGMVVAHRAELITQAANKIEAVTGERPDIERANLVARDDLYGRTKIVVSTVQTQVAGKEKKRMEKFNPSSFSLLILDEAHHATASSWRAVVEHYRQNPDLKVIGFTATPDRLDKMALLNIFDETAFEYTLPEAIDDGWLVPIRQRMVEVESLDYSGIRTTAGDLNGRDLAQVMEDEHVLHEVATPVVEMLNGRKALIFAASVVHAEQLAEIFCRHGLRAASVCGTTPEEERNETNRKFAGDELDILVNVGVYTEGYDNPKVQVVVIARPTKSRALYSQMIGRGTRTLEGLVDSPTLSTPKLRRAAIQSSDKPYMEVLDFSGNCGRHKLVTCMDILGGKMFSDAVIERAEELAADADESVFPEDVLRQADAEEKAKIAAEKERIRKAEAAKRAKLLAQVKYATKCIDPFDTMDIHVPVEQAKYKEGATEKQIDMLEKHGVDATEFTKRQASKVISEIFRRRDEDLCSLKQMDTLKKYDIDGKEMLFEDAGQTIDLIANNGWRGLP